MATSTNDLCHQSLNNNGRPQQRHTRRHMCHSHSCGGGRLSAGCIFLTVTLVVTVTSSGLMVLALLTDFWEYVDFDRGKVEAIADNATRVEWLMDNRVARLTFAGQATPAAGPLLIPHTGLALETIRAKRGVRIVYLVPMYGGVWTICTNLDANERSELEVMGYKYAACKQYLSPEYIVEGPNDWMTRMQNLSISCAMVCLILLGASALLGLFGLCKRQISAVLVTGVMYILAAVFCTFTLSIMHFKRRTSKDCGLVDRMIPERYQNAQLLSTGWSLSTGWISVSLCLLTAFLWYFLSKIMRYGPITLT